MICCVARREPVSALHSLCIYNVKLFCTVFTPFEKESGEEFKEGAVPKVEGVARRRASGGSCSRVSGWESSQILSCQKSPVFTEGGRRGEDAWKVINLWLRLQIWSSAKKRREERGCEEEREHEGDHEALLIAQGKWGRGCSLSKVWRQWNKNKK